MFRFSSGFAKQDVSTANYYRPSKANRCKKPRAHTRTQNLLRRTHPFVPSNTFFDQKNWVQFSVGCRKPVFPVQIWLIPIWPFASTQMDAPWKLTTNILTYFQVSTINIHFALHYPNFNNFLHPIEASHYQFIIITASFLPIRAHKFIFQTTHFQVSTSIFWGFKF